MSIQKFFQDVSYDNICQEAMQALSTDIKFDKDVTIPILKIAFLHIDCEGVNVYHMIGNILINI